MVCRPHFIHGPPLKGLFLCLLVLATRKRVYILFYANLVGYLIFSQLILNIFLDLLFVLSYRVYEIPSSPEVPISILVF